jgi:tetratricopeptide (TPR) repeat protein/tRNA A-37 threonylcarbamoyl transferase component Bud32
MNDERFSLNDTIVLRNSRTRYKVFGIKKGGFGVIYLVEELGSHEKKALKTIKNELLRTDAVCRRFSQEAELWARIPRHPNIVAAEFVDTIGEYIPCIVLEFVDGGSLHETLASSVLSVSLAIRILRQVADGMLHVWNRMQLVHRDLKPANVLLSADKLAKIADFGMTNNVKKEGTLWYSAPEQAERVDVDTRADIYAFGVMAYQMLTGRLPFRLKNPTPCSLLDSSPAIQDYRTVGMPNPHAVNPSLPPQLGELIEKCIARDPELRPRSFAEVLASIPEDPHCRPPTIGSSTDAGRGAFADAIFGLNAWKAMELNSEGASMANLGYHEKALAYYARALELNPGIAEIWKNRATALLALKDYLGAAECSAKAITLFDRNRAAMLPGSVSEDVGAMAWTNLTAALSELGELDDALDACNEALVLYPHFERLWNNKAAVLLRLNKLEDALACVTKAVELNPRYERAFHLRGAIESELGDHDRAMACFDRLLQLNPRSVEGHWGKAQRYLNRGQYDEFQGKLDELTRLTPPDVMKHLYEKLFERFSGEIGRPDEKVAETLELLGELAMRAERFEMARGYFEASLRQGTGRADILNKLGYCLFETGAKEKAFECFTECVALDECNANAHLNLGRYYLDARDTDQALRSLNQALALDQGLDMAWSNLAAAKVMTGCLPEAQEALSKALELNPNNSYAWLNMGVCRFMMENLEGARACLEQAIVLNPQLQGARTLLARCQANPRRG